MSAKKQIFKSKSKFKLKSGHGSATLSYKDQQTGETIERKLNPGDVFEYDPRLLPDEMFEYLREYDPVMNKWVDASEVEWNRIRALDKRNEKLKAEAIKNIIPLIKVSDILGISIEEIINYGINGQICIGKNVGDGKVYYFQEKDLSTILDSEKHIKISEFKSVYVECPDKDRGVPPVPITTIGLDCIVSVRTLCTTKKSLDRLKEILKNETPGNGLKEKGNVLVADKEKERDSPLYKKTPENVKWQDLTMVFPNHLEDKVDVIFKGKKTDTVSLKDLEFVDRKATKTFKPLEALTLLKRFAKDKDIYLLPPRDEKERKNLHAQVDSLRNVLKQCFGIDGDPVPANDEGGYRLQFKACCYDVKVKQEVDTYHDSINECFRELEMEANNSGEFRSNDNIQVIKQSIVGIAEEIVQRASSFRLSDVICIECYQKIPTYILSNDNIQILCNDCTPEPTNEYESKSFEDYKNKDIPRSD